MSNVREPSLLRDFPERTFSVSFFELCESDGLFWIFDNCVVVVVVGFDGDVVRPSLVSFWLLALTFFGRCWFDDCWFGGDDDEFDELFAQAADTPLTDDVPMPETHKN